MKAKWLLLTKVQMKGLLGLNKLRKTDDRRVKNRAVGAAVLLSFAVAAIILYDILAAFLFVMQDAEEALPPFMLAIASFIVLIFSLIRGSSILFSAKDHDLVMSLPVTKRTVIVSRLACSYFVNLAFTLLVMLPSCAVYFIAGAGSFYDFFVILAATLFAPLLPLAAATAVGTLVAAAASRFRHKSFAQSLLNIVFFVVILIASFALSYGMQSEPDMASVSQILAGKIYPPAQLIALALGGQAWAVFAFAAICAAAFALLVAIAAPFYEKIVSRLAAKSGGVAFKEKQIRTSSAFGALFKKELKRLTASPAYLLNSIVGVLFLLIAAVAFLIFDPVSTLAEALRSSGLERFLPSLVYGGGGLTLMFVGMILPSAASVSMEGKSCWIMCSLPLPARTVLLAKSATGPVFSVPAALFFNVVLLVQTAASPLQWIVLLLSPVAYAAFVSMAGAGLNYKFPRYDWTNETAAVKNSVPALILSFGGLAVEGVFIAAAIFLTRLGFIAYILFILISILGCVLLWRAFGKARLFDGSPSPAVYRMPAPSRRF